MRVAWIVIGVMVSLPLHGEVSISEIMFNPAQGEEFEYVELANTGLSPVDLSGWAFTNGVRYTFPDGTVVAPGGYLIVSASRTDFLGAYPAVPESAVLGDFEGQLDNGGERLTLSDAAGNDVESLRYDDNPPWDFLADGFGASLERSCFDAAADLAENWRSSPLPSDPETEFGGTPARAAGPQACPPEFPARPPVFFSEIMYHAVLEESVEDEYEYLEIHNAGDTAVPLAGWRLAAGVEYTFPEGASIDAGAYIVIARNPAKLAEVPGYDLNPAALHGPYARTLDNGGEKVALVTADGQGIDSVNYDDQAPWPLGADALGAGERWLPSELLPLEDHRHKGHSLERISFAVPSGVVANWAPSPLDGMTPGRANASAGGDVPTIVDEIAVRAVDGTGDLIRSDQEVSIEVEFSPTAPVSATLEYFIEDVERDDEEILSAPLAAAGGVFVARLPGRPDNTIVRYRVRADRGGGGEVLSPRPTDPHGWHAYFVAPLIDTETRVYQLFIGRRNWGQLNSNIGPNRVSGCNPNPRWNEREPAIFVHNGRVFDAQVRFQGSRWNRANGGTISGWRVPGPTPGPVAVRSWRIALPRYAELEGRSVLVLNKLTQGCPGYNAGVGYRLFAQADLPSPEVRFAQFHINGQYYHYMMEYERPGEEMLRRYHREMAEKYPDSPSEKVGHYFKSIGCTCDEGPYGWGDWRLLNDFCGFPREERYAWTYDRKTHQWDDNAALIKLIDDMHRARSQGIDAMREYILENYDFERLMSYIAIINWSVPFDDMFQNHFIYQRLSDGKWLLTPWDLDRNFGEWQGFNSSVFMGRQGDSSNRSGWWHRLKDTVLRAFEEEYLDHLLLLNNTILHPDNVVPLIDEVTSQSNLAEAQSAPVRLSCGTFAARAASFRAFALSRHALINSQIAGVSVDAGPDQVAFAGRVVQFDATGSEPDPGPAVSYVWDNGMEGDSPSFVFDEPGVFEITLTVTARGIPFVDAVVVTVLAVPEQAFAPDRGTLVIEAESFFMNERRGSEDTWWEEASEIPGFSGAGYMHAVEVSRRTFTRNYASTAPELRYAVQFDAPGTYRVWFRGFVASSRSDTVNIGLDGKERGTSDYTDFEVDENNMQWGGSQRGGDPQELVVEEAGLHLLSVWLRESGFVFDKLLLTLDTDLVPEALGPAESGRVPTGDRGAVFVRGDANGDGLVNLTDAIDVLGYLFGGRRVLACEDHGDVDDDGALQLTDAIGLLSYLFEQGAPPRPPFPTPGLDPTPDALPCNE